MNNCVFCGQEAGQCSHEFKKMCINCKFAQKTDDEGYLCANEENLAAVKEKMMQAASGISDSYIITDFDIKPQPLKKPLCKCKRWELSDDVIEQLKNLFV